MKTVVIQKAVVINDSGQILALKRSNTDVRRPLQWDLPGGWLDPNETHEQGLLREVYEEAGIATNDLTAPELFYSETAIKTWQEGPDATQQGNCVFLFYTVNTTTDKEITLSSEHVAYAWMDIATAQKEFTYDLHVRVLQHLELTK